MPADRNQIPQIKPCLKPHSLGERGLEEVHAKRFQLGYRQLPFASAVGKRELV